MKRQPTVKALQARGVGHRLRFANRLILRAFVDELANIGMPYVYYRCLSPLLDEDGITQTELSIRSGIEPPSATDTLDKLAKEGFVRRVAHGSDRRKRLVVLTAKGRKYCEQLPAFLTRINAEFLAGITKAEYRSFCEILERIEENAERFSATALAVEAAPPRVERPGNATRPATQPRSAAGKR